MVHIAKCYVVLFYDASSGSINQWQEWKSDNKVYHSLRCIALALTLQNCNPVLHLSQLSSYLCHSLSHSLSHSLCANWRPLQMKCYASLPSSLPSSILLHAVLLTVLYHLRALKKEHPSSIKQKQHSSSSIPTQLLKTLNRVSTLSPYNLSICSIKDHTVSPYLHFSFVLCAHANYQTTPPPPPISLSFCPGKSHSVKNTLANKTHFHTLHALHIVDLHFHYSLRFYWQYHPPPHIPHTVDRSRLLHLCYPILHTLLCNALDHQHVTPPYLRTS